MYSDLAIEKMMNFYEGLKDVGNLEERPKKQMNVLIMIITPKQ